MRKLPESKSRTATEGRANEQSERRLSFHSLRHTFVTVSRLARISEAQVQALAGHRSSQMMDRYSHPRQAADMDGCRLALECVSGGCCLENPKN